MPNTPNTSFIPKQGPVRRPRQAASRRVHVFSIFAYIAFASTLVSSVGVFFYQKHVEKQLEGQVAQLDEAISGFSEEDMTQVREFNNRLTQTRDRLEKGVSIVAIFEALESAVLQAVSFEDMDLVRAEDGDIELQATLLTDSFDSTLFQRGVFERSDIVNSVEVEDLAIELGSSSEDGESASGEGVSFIAKIGVPAASVPNVPRSGVSTPDNTSLNESENGTSTATSSDDVSINVEDLNEVTL